VVRLVEVTPSGSGCAWPAIDRGEIRGITGPASGVRSTRLDRRACDSAAAGEAL